MSDAHTTDGRSTGAAGLSGDNTQTSQGGQTRGPTRRVKDVAEAAGGSLATVSHVLNDNPRGRACAQTRQRFSMRPRGGIIDLIGWPAGFGPARRRWSAPSPRRSP